LGRRCALPMHLPCARAWRSGRWLRWCRREQQRNHGRPRRCRLHRRRLRAAGACRPRPLRRRRARQSHPHGLHCLSAWPPRRLLRWRCAWSERSHRRLRALLRAAPSRRRRRRRPRRPPRRCHHRHERRPRSRCAHARSVGLGWHRRRHRLLRRCRPRPRRVGPCSVCHHRRHRHRCHPPHRGETRRPSPLACHCHWRVAVGCALVPRAPQRRRHLHPAPPARCPVHRAARLQCRRPLHT
jgi:hypothetical protein